MSFGFLYTMLKILIGINVCELLTGQSVSLGCSDVIEHLICLLFSDILKMVHFRELLTGQ